MKDYVLFIGNMGNDPKISLKPTKKGDKEFVSFSFMTYGNNFRKFHPCVAWGVTARTIFQYLKKGDFAVIEGFHMYNDWTDKQGTKHYTTDITVIKVYFDKKGKEISDES